MFGSHSFKSAVTLFHFPELLRWNRKSDVFFTGLSANWVIAYVSVGVFCGERGGKGPCDDTRHQRFGPSTFYFFFLFVSFFLSLDICADLFTPFVPTVLGWKFLTHQLLCLAAA